MTDDFKTIIRKQIEARHTWGDPDYVPEHWWASAVTRCSRELYYRVIGIKPSHEKENYFRQEIGSLFHIFLQGLIVDAKLNLEPAEFKGINEYLKLVAKNDNRIPYLDKDDVIVDYKTVSNCYPNYIYNKIKTADKPRKKDIFQIHCNMFVHKKEWGLIVYANLEAVNTGIYRDFLLPFLIQREQQYIDYIINKFLYLNDCIARKVVPEMETDKCTYCSFKYLCAGKPRKNPKVLEEEK